jgi:hypothetical protein
VFCICSLSAQQPDENAKRTLEHRIKGKQYNYERSDYIYGEASETTKEAALKNALDALASEINKTAPEHPEWQTANSIKTRDIEHNVGMIDFIRGNRFRVIAYISKDSVQFALAAKTSVKNDDKPVSATKTSVKNDDKPVSATKTSVNDDKPATVKTQPAAVQDRIKDTAAQVSKIPQLASKKADSVPEQILAAASYSEALNILKAGKPNVAYGKMDRLLAPEKAYLIVYEDSSGEIIAVLDKGNDDSRRNLRSPDKIFDNELLKQYQVTWFQLF